MDIFFYTILSLLSLWMVISSNRLAQEGIQAVNNYISDLAESVFATQSPFGPEVSDFKSILHETQLIN